MLSKAGCVFFGLTLVCANCVFGKGYVIPDVKIEMLRPKGVRVSVPGDPKLTYFVFHGNINKRMMPGTVGMINCELNDRFATTGDWQCVDDNIILNIGDIIYYYMYLVRDNIGYLKNNTPYTIKAFVALDSSNESVVDCSPTKTLLKNGKACAGQILFEDNFDTLREDLWQIEQYIPDEPDYPFVSYQRPPNAPTVSVQDGYLYIQPILQQDLPGFSQSSIYSDTLDLITGCSTTSTKCLIEASGANILPPIASGRLTSKTFSFTYGIVEIRAKLPQGDWLYPDILLEPVMKKYGALNYASGVLRIAGARGNAQLSAVNNEVGNKLLYGGAVMSAGCHYTLLTEKISNKPWGDDFHVYSVRWEPERITLSVDDEEWARVEPAANGLQGRFHHSCDLPRRFLSRGARMAPFDDYFSVTLGLSAGGITEFSDRLTSAGRAKPWRNSSRKASLNFWQDISSWNATWTQPHFIFYVSLGMRVGGDFADGPDKPWKNRSSKAVYKFWENKDSWYSTRASPEMLVDSVNVYAL